LRKRVNNANSAKAFANAVDVQYFYQKFELLYIAKLNFDSKMKSYKEHLSSIKSFGEQVSVKRRPVFRGSAIFPVIQHAKLNTRVLYMGYWMVKNNITELGLLITLRDQLGTIIYRDTQQINNPSSKEVEVGGILKAIEFPGDYFEGSIELEIFSSKDLVFPFPAFVVNYYNEKGSSAVHTTGRVYNDVEDMQSNSVEVKECGFDLFPGEDMDPFFAFVNGHEVNSNAQFTLEVISKKGISNTKEISIGELSGLESKFIKLKDFLPIDEWIEGEVGTLKITHNLKGMFPRFIAGNFSKSAEALAITHTYYDNSKNSSEDAYWTNTNPDLMHDSSVFVPLFLDDDWYSELKLYPIYSPSEHTIEVQFFDEKGKIVHTIENFLQIANDHNEFVEVNFNELVEAEGLNKSEIKGVMLIKHCAEKNRIPSRLKYGLNVGRKGRAFDLPTNICFASSVSNEKIITKSGTFKWLPLLNSGHSVGIIENSSFVKDYQQKAEVTANYYKKDNPIPLTRNFTINPNGQVRLELDDELAAFADGNAIWVTIQANSPFVKAWYFEFNESGIMGGDHSF